MGVIHGEEVEYVFGQPLRYPHNHTLAENELSRRVMQYFVRFAATGYDSLTLFLAFSSSAC